MAKLLLLSPNGGLAFPGIRANAMSTFEVGKGPLADWRVFVRGPSVFFESPPGWQPGASPSGTARRIYEVARADMRMGWELAEGEDLASLVNWTPPARELPVTSSISQAPPQPSQGLEAPPASIEEPDPGDPDGLPVVAKRGPGRPRRQ